MADSNDNTPRYWNIVQPLPAPILAQMAQQLEAQGVHGVFAPQVYGPPFIPLAVVAGATERLQLASGIAIAAARSPFETAMAAIDLDRFRWALRARIGHECQRLVAGHLRCARA